LGRNISKTPSFTISIPRDLSSISQKDEVNTPKVSPKTLGLSEEEFPPPIFPFS